jgi:hypothetical protein
MKRRIKRKLWVEFEEPKQVEASLTYSLGRGEHERVTHIVITWYGKQIKLPHVDLYHKVKRGLRVLHVYSCADEKMEVFFRILHDAKRQNVYVVGADGKYIDSWQ